jgi:peptidoglycan-N-acetylglucosamine deacetylase
MTVKNILTVDLEDWFHICGVGSFIPRESWDSLESRVVENTTKLLDILGRAKTLATFFVLGSVAEKNPELIRKISGSGHEIASHGYAHRRVYTITPDLFRDDLRKSADILTGITGDKVKGYRAPEWSIRDGSMWALNILLEEGFQYDSSMAPLPIIGNPNYPTFPWKHRLSGGEMWEIPPLVGVTRLISLPFGGGWGLRTFPYSLIRSAIIKNNQKGMPSLIFIHPREFDSNCPRVRLPLIKRFVLNASIESTEKRLERLLNDFEFTRAADFISYGLH